MAKKKEKKTFGAKLKVLRKKEGLSLEDLAEQVGMEPAHLDSLEKDKALPPVGDIIKLARTLSVEPSAFMGIETTGASAGKRRKAVASRTDNYAYDILSPEADDKHMMAFRVTIDPKSKHGKVGYNHEGEEFIYVLSGKLKITVGGKTSTLGPGKSIHFDSGKKHVLSNPGAEPTVLVVVVFTK